MLIEFIPNPSYKPPAPAIRVGSVVKTMDGYKRFVLTVDEYSHRHQYNLYGHGWHTRDFFEPLPERVSGWDENGPQFSPIDPPPQEFSWEQYPPRAGMVVEHDSKTNVDRLRVLLSHAGFFNAYNRQGHSNGYGDVGEIKSLYRPRPDLMPRFVEQKR